MVFNPSMYRRSKKILEDKKNTFKFILQFQRHFFIPLLLTANACKQQMQELKSIIQKKDEEIKQYHREGFVLHRSEFLSL